MPYTHEKTEPHKPLQKQESQLVFLSDQKATDDYHTTRINLRRGRPTVRVNILGASKEFIVDSGSGVSLTQPGIYRSEVRPSSSTSFGATGDGLNISG